MADPKLHNAARKPRPIAPNIGVSPESMNNALNYFTGVLSGSSDKPQPAPPPSTIPTPMGWLTPEMAERVLMGMMPHRNALSGVLGAPMDGAAWAARRLGARGIPGGYVESDRPGAAPGWAPSADVPLSSANILSLINRYRPQQ